MSRQTFGVIVTTRSFFPSHLVRTAREETFALLDRLGYDYVCVSEDETEYGAIVTHQDAKICADLFRKASKAISGIIVVLPNFGEELGVSDAIEMAGLDVPVLIQSCDDDFAKLDMANRRDAFCGKISLCNNLRQRSIKYTLTSLHTCAINGSEFADDVERFAGICRVVTGLRGSRIAMLGARPGAFNTVRFSEKILQKHKIAVQTVDFSEIIFNALNYADQAKVDIKMAEIHNYGSIPEWIDNETMIKQAKLCLAISEKVEELDCDASTVQCWDSVQNNYGCATCLSMSMMGEEGKPSACESDVTGAVSMLAARLASGNAPALLDWNNNLRDDRDCCIALHCSNFPKSFFATDVEIESLDVLGSTLGKENCFGAVKGQAAPGDFTFIRLTTDDVAGQLRAYVGEGQLKAEPLPTKGGLANVHVSNLQGLLKHICKNGFEHHVCFVRGQVADILTEALGNYIGADVYRHN